MTLFCRRGLSLCHQFVVRFFTYAFPGVFAPLDAGLDIIVNLKTTPAALHGDVVREDLDLIATLGALFYCERGCSEVNRTRTTIEHKILIVHQRTAKKILLTNHPIIIITIVEVQTGMSGIDM